mgnify:CR=1 FL=1
MKFEIAGQTKRSFSMVSISHGNEAELIINAQGYTSTKPGAMREDDKLELFGEMNEFMAALPEEKQLDLYNHYSRLDSVLASYGDVTNRTGNDLDECLTEIARDIFTIIKYEDLREYIIKSRHMQFPSELTDDYVTADKITPSYKDKTYLKAEYIDLTAAVMGLRWMIPIWGSYLPIASKEHGARWKEYKGYALLGDTSLKQSPAFERLETYIRANIKDEDFELAVVFQHLSSEEIPTYLMALAVIRKLSVSPLSYLTANDHLMKVVYNYVCGPKNRMTGVFGDEIKKKTDNEGMVDDSNGSVLDIFKMKEAVSTGELAIFELYVKDYVDAAFGIDTEIDQDRVELCVNYATSIENYDYDDAQITVCIWVMSTVLAGCVIEMFDRRTLLTAMGIAQTVLWKWNFKQLAALLTATPVKLEDGQKHNTPPRVDINSANMARLAAIYPYTLPSDGKRADSGNSTNVGVRDVETVATVLLGCSWEPRCPRDLARECDRADVTRRLDPTPDLRDELAELLIQLDEFKR